ncbi:hypothetical protein CSUI_006012, partial [Cystoisospora suis]
NPCSGVLCGVRGYLRERDCLYGHPGRAGRTRDG